MSKETFGTNLQKTQPTFYKSKNKLLVLCLILFSESNFFLYLYSLLVYEVLLLYWLINNYNSNFNRFFFTRNMRMGFYNILCKSRKSNFSFFLYILQLLPSFCHFFLNFYSREKKNQRMPKILNILINRTPLNEKLNLVKIFTLSKWRIPFGNFECKNLDYLKPGEIICQHKQLTIHWKLGQ